MALPMPIPAWLQVTPGDYLSAAQSGLQLGLSAARMYQEANEFNTRLAEASKENQMERQAKAESQERAYLLDQQRNMMESEYRHQLISQKQQQAKQSAEIAKAKAQEGIAHWQEMQRMAELRAKAGIVLGPGASLRDRNTGEVLAQQPFRPSSGLTQADKAQELKIKSQIKEWDAKIKSETDADKKELLIKQRDALYEQLGMVGQTPSNDEAAQPVFKSQPGPPAMAGPDWTPTTGLITNTPPVIDEMGESTPQKRLRYNPETGDFE